MVICKYFYHIDNVDKMYPNTSHEKSYRKHGS